MKNTYYILIILVFISCHSKNSWKCEGDCYNGKGIKKWKDGGIEKGTWKNGELFGPGYQYYGKTSKYAGDYYEGNFKNGYDGHGTYFDKSEDATYVGGFKNGKTHGKGKLSYGPNAKCPGMYYDGDWKDGKQDGYGVKYWGKAGKHTNNKYQGEWKNDSLDGFGRYDWADGGYYIGEWRNGEQDGEGVYTFPDGKQIKSIWKKGYCRELALIMYGESASTFNNLISEINESTRHSCQRFVDAMSMAMITLKSNPNAEIDYRMLKELCDSAKVDNAKTITQLSDIEEYDKAITFKTDFEAIHLAFRDVLNGTSHWIEESKKANDKNKLESIRQKIYEKLVVMKDKQVQFNKTKSEFTSKYLK